jgi:hypothetical protein
MAKKKLTKSEEIAQTEQYIAFLEKAIASKNFERLDPACEGQFRDWQGSHAIRRTAAPSVCVTRALLAESYHC